MSRDQVQIDKKKQNKNWPVRMQNSIGGAVG
jgi:hypothetical protein